ncbi:histone H1-I [Salmo trutta]|nr:histone H1-I-like [Salmo trutta]
MWQPDPFHNELVSIMDELMTSLEEEIDKRMAFSVSSTQYSTDIDSGETREIERESKLEVKVELTCVMKQFVKQTIAKINQLISKGTAALRSEMSQSQSEMKSLKMKLLEMADSKEVPENTVERTPQIEEEWTEAPLSPEFAKDFEVDVPTPSGEADNTTNVKKETTIRAKTIAMEQSFIAKIPSSSLIESIKQVAITDKQAASRPTDKQAASRPTDKQAASRPTDKQAASRPTDKQAASRPTDKQAASRPTDKQAASRPTDKQAASRPTDKQAASRPTDKKVASTSTDNQAPSTDPQTPSGDSVMSTRPRRKKTRIEAQPTAAESDGSEETADDQWEEENAKAGQTSNDKSVHNIKPRPNIKKNKTTTTRKEHHCLDCG